LHAPDGSEERDGEGEQWRQRCRVSSEGAGDVIDSKGDVRVA